MRSRPLLTAGAAGLAFWWLTACGSDTKVCPLSDIAPQVWVTWQADELPYGETDSYRMCVESHCDSGEPLVAYGRGQVSVRLPEDFGDRRPEVRLTLTARRGTANLTTSGTATLRMAVAECDQALQGGLRLTADGVLKDASQRLKDAS